MRRPLDDFSKPIKEPEAPSDEDIDRMLQELEAGANFPVLELSKEQREKSHRLIAFVQKAVDDGIPAEDTMRSILLGGDILQEDALWTCPVARTKASKVSMDPDLRSELKIAARKAGIQPYWYLDGIVREHLGKQV